LALYNKKNQNKKFFKRRLNSDSKKQRIIFGEYAIVCKNNGLFEFTQINMLKKVLKKKFIRMKRPETAKQKAWFFYVKNCVLSKKSKNARMGKGKGSNYRWGIKVRRNHTLVEVIGVNLIFLKRAVRFLNQRLSVHLMVLGGFNYKRAGSDHFTYMTPNKHRWEL